MGTVPNLAHRARHGAHALILRSRPAAARLVVVLAVAVAAGGAARAEPSDADFLAAKAAFDRGDRARVAAIAPQFSGNLLEPYVAYWQLKLGLDGATRDDVRRYWERWPDTPLADRLRVDWLKIAGSRGDWATFALDYRPSAGEDTELACYAIQYRRVRDPERALLEAKPLWFTGQATPDACEPLFAALIKSNGVTPADRRARFRLAVEAGNFRFAQSFAADLPPGDRISAQQFAAVERDPAKALAAGDFAWLHNGGRALALYALERAARTDAVGARAAWVKQRARLPEDDRRYGNARLAFHAARQLAPSANDWYREAAGAPMNEMQRAWQVRAALRAASWPDVLAAVEAMPAAQARESAWRYWRARALDAAGRADEAAAIHAGLAQETNFYGVLAGEALGRAAVLSAVLIARS
jgi:soluble lytic murein transglycosylase